MQQESIHKDHRQRLKNRFLNCGLDDFTDIQILELLLFYGIPYKDTNPTAHKLLKHFGTLSGVFQANINDLKRVGGIGEHTALLIHLITELIRAYKIDELKKNAPLKTLEECGVYMMPYFFGIQTERVYLLCLDAQSKPICCKMISDGSLNSASFSMRKMISLVLTTNASAVVLAHNHPSGVALPSDEDILTTQRVAEALQAVDVLLVDHVIVAEGDYISMTQSGYEVMAQKPY